MGKGSEMIPKTRKHNRIKPRRSAPMTAQEKRHADRIAQMFCLCCGTKPVELHHEKEPCGGRRDHRYIAPLCSVCHRTGEHARHAIGRDSFNALLGFNLREWCEQEWSKSEELEDV
ncbi:MAG: hypothetical protein Unbinned4811contig1001_59 [Prokaryotic dsDNA virus sp.]|jgi:hypothetical protein|nr:MAG: hypothetical protein Unbinned4811contig1001_59 [Prokaryotic dsDNA virus sp.]